MEIQFAYFLLFCVLFDIGNCTSSMKLASLKNRVKEMFYFAYDSYLTHAYPLDELRPLSCDGHDTWGSFSLTLVDSLDTLIVLGNYTEFRRAVDLLVVQLDPNKNVNVSVFETNIRVVGGLLSAHLLAKRAGISEPGWPCHGKLLDLAERFASKILPAFNTPTGMPYGTVNLALGGVPPKETPITCTATIGTSILEFGALSRLTGDLRYEEAAMKALRALWKYRSKLGLVGNHINVLTGVWVGTEATIGSGIDSYFEYLLKGSIMYRLPELDAMFREYRANIKKHLKYDSWHFVVSMYQGSVTSPVFQSLESFWPGILAMAGDIEEAKQILVKYHSLWKKYGFVPELFDVSGNKPMNSRFGYPLRPEFIESIMHLYRATRDPYLFDVGEDVLTSIEAHTRTQCGYATVHNVNTHTLENRMESFFLSETIKYLYLLFDTENFLHNLPSEQSATADVDTDRCELGGGGYIFNTEAHPLDAGLIHCCSLQRVRELEETSDVLIPLPLNSGLHTDLTSLLISSDQTKKNTTRSSGSLELQLLGQLDAGLQHMFEWDAAVRGNSNVVGSEAWALALWQDMTKLVLLPPKSAYPLEYEPPSMRTNPPLLTCPVIPFNVYLKPFQDMDVAELA